jgi:hypothetical protein
VEIRVLSRKALLDALPPGNYKEEGVSNQIRLVMVFFIQFQLLILSLHFDFSRTALVNYNLNPCKISLEGSRVSN